MRVLVITRNAWDDTNSIGNTMSNFFSGMDDAEFANIYFRPSRPNNNMCRRYFRVTEKDVLRHWFCRERMGEVFTTDECGNVDAGISTSGTSLAGFVRRYGIAPIYKLSDALWNGERWINGRFVNFIKGFSPDIVFSFAKAAPQYYCTLKYFYEHTNVPVVLWAADDEYSSARGTAREERLRYIIKNASKLYGCSEEICAYYNAVFSCNVEPVYKSCQFHNMPKKTVNRPLNFTYAGNLLYGRQETLLDLIDAIQALNQDEEKAILHIYSGTEIGTKDIQRLNVPGVSVFHGKESYEKICEHLANADVVLHVESFQPSEMLKTKYSFSTKIVDCLQSGSVLMAIGPDDIASIQYARNIKGAIVVDDRCVIQDVLNQICNHPEELYSRAADTYAFSIDAHGKQKLQIRLKEDFLKLCSVGKPL